MPSELVVFHQAYGVALQKDTPDGAAGPLHHLDLVGIVNHQVEVLVEARDTAFNHREGQHARNAGVERGTCSEGRGRSD